MGELLFVSACGDERIDILAREGDAYRPLAGVRATGGPRRLRLNRARNRLYAAMQDGTLTIWGKKPDGLELLQQLRARHRLCNLALTPDETAVVAVSYNGGTVEAWALGADGLHGGGHSAVRTGFAAHDVVFPGGGRFLVPHPDTRRMAVLRHLGGGVVEQARTFHAEVDARHMAVGGHGLLYGVGFRDRVVCVYRPAGDSLRLLQTVPSVPTDYRGPHGGADIHLRADGRLLYASSRGHDSVSAYAVDAATGLLTPTGCFPTDEEPMVFCVSPDGRRVVTAGRMARRLRVETADPATGLPVDTAYIPAGDNIQWLLADAW